MDGHLYVFPEAGSVFYRLHNRQMNEAMAAQLPGKNRCVRHELHIDLHGLTLARLLVGEGECSQRKLLRTHFVHL